MNSRSSSGAKVASEASYAHGGGVTDRLALPGALRPLRERSIHIRLRAIRHTPRAARLVVKRSGLRLLLLKRGCPLGRGRVRGQKLRRSLPPLRHPLPELHRLLRVEARLGHQDQADAIGLAFLSATVGLGNTQIEPQPEGRDDQALGFAARFPHIEYRQRPGRGEDLRHTLCAVARDDVAHFVAHDRRQLIRVGREGDHPGVDPDLSARQRKRVHLGRIEDHDLPLARKLLSRCIENRPTHASNVGVRRRILAHRLPLLEFLKRLYAHGVHLLIRNYDQLLAPCRRGGAGHGTQNARQRCETDFHEPESCVRLSSESRVERNGSETPKNYVGRLAPSPTGRIHLGIAQTSLAAWLDARAAGGYLILRIEDVDQTRCREEAVAGIVQDLAWLGIDWDVGPGSVNSPPSLEGVGPHRQSQRSDLYRDMLGRLATAGRIFHCTCTRREVLAASAPHGPADEGPRYPGTCRESLRVRPAASPARPPSTRLRTEPGEIVRHVDRRLGPLEENVHQRVGDFVLRRSDGLWAYQFAVSVDDLLQGVTSVVRGDDLWASTGRQLLLRELLGDGAPSIETLHVPLVYGPDGKRLAKRDGADSLAAMRDRGTSPAQVLGTLAHGLGLKPLGTVRRPQDLLPAWTAAYRRAAT